MTITEFQNSIHDQTPPSNLSTELQALWFDAQGNWDEAHRLAQDSGSRDGAWVHAYLHRKEGDASNARYWYRQAQRTMPALSLEQEWVEIATALLEQ
jgi:hypothetical protein